VPHGSTAGTSAGGKRARLLSISAAGLGYKCHIFDPHDHPCAADVAARFTQASFGDDGALAAFGDSVDVATYEFENLPVEALKVLDDKLKPGVKSLAIAQDRAREKQFIETAGARVAPRRSIEP